MGKDRYKHPKKKLPPFLRVERDLFCSSVWKELSHPAVRVYLCFRCAENKFNSRELKISYEYFRGKGGGGYGTIARAIRELVEAGLIDIIKSGGTGAYKAVSIYGLSERWREKQNATTPIVVVRYYRGSGPGRTGKPAATKTVALEPKT